MTLHSENILNMHKRRKIILFLRHYNRLYKELLRVELELSRIMKDCPQKTSCFLRYGVGFKTPYGLGDPLDDVADWQLVLADFYCEQANKLFFERDEILKRQYALATRIYKLKGKALILRSGFRHLRKPWFKRITRARA